MLPPPSAWMVRTALLHQVLGFGLGGLLLAGAPWPRGFVPLIEAHLLIVLIGFALQLAMGVAYSAFPRRGGSRGDARLAWAAYALVNAGVLGALVPPAAPGGPAWRVVGQTLVLAGALVFAVAIRWRIRPAPGAGRPAAAPPAP